MGIVKVIEVISEGESIEAAMQSAIKEVTKSVKNVKQINVVHIEGQVDKDRIVRYRVNANISFLISEDIEKEKQQNKNKDSGQDKKDNNKNSNNAPKDVSRDFNKDNKRDIYKDTSKDKKDKNKK